VIAMRSPLSRRCALAVLLALLWAIGEASAQRPATDSTWSAWPITVSDDGTEITLQQTAADSLRICVEPAVGQFGPKRCYRVGDIRAGRVVRQ